MSNELPFTIPELADYCAWIVNATPAAMETSDVALVCKKNNIPGSRTHIWKALQHAANAGLIEVTVTDSGHWRFYSKQWSLWGGDL